MDQGDFRIAKSFWTWLSPAGFVDEAGDQAVVEVTVVITAMMG